MSGHGATGGTGRPTAGPTGRPAAGPRPVVALAGVAKRLGVRPVLAGLSVRIEAGELVVLLGPNGAGKTTLVDLVVGLRQPDAGNVRLWGQPPGASASRRRLGFLPQDVSFPDTLRVGELVALATAHLDAPSPAAVLADHGLSGLARRQAGGLSGGQRRLVAVALALAGSPELVVLDEPSTGLDVEARRGVWETLRRYHSAGGTVLLTTHNLDEAAALATRVLVLDGGVIIRDGTADELRGAVPAATVSFALVGPARWTTWPEVLHGDVEDGRVQLLTAQPDALVRRLVASEVCFRDLRVAPASLEDAFLAIVAGRR